MNPRPDTLERIHAILGEPRRFLFFTGKGGVGKTSLACAVATALADVGRRVLLISTDPASNLDEVLATPLSNSPTPIPEVPGLQALNVDPQAAAQAYRDRLIAPLRGQLPPAVLRSMEEQLSGGCTTEIAAFDEFSRWLGDPSATAAFDHVVFDTAPTGHTLRLLSLPGAWTGFLASNESGYSCLGPLSGLQKQRDTYALALQALQDPGRTNLILVARPQSAALNEAERASHELAAIGITHQRLVVNAVFRASGNDAVAVALERRGDAALNGASKFLAQLPVAFLPLRHTNWVGIQALRAAFQPEADPGDSIAPSAATSVPPELESLDHLVRGIARSGHGVIMTLGKGGVGKTTLAVAIAVRLAELGHAVHLSTTDPAAHLQAVAMEDTGLEISRIDPRAEIESYVSQTLAAASPGLDPEARALLEEDLRSPCTEEIAVFRAFARIVAQGADRFVVLDTAPTGHTLLLLDASEAYHREIARKASNLPQEVQQLLPRLRDPDWTKVLVVTLPEPTPVHEAAALQSDLRRAGIEPYGWVINQSLAASGTRDPLLASRAEAEAPFLIEIHRHLATRTAIVPWLIEEPRGREQLRRLFHPPDRGRPRPADLQPRPPGQPEPGWDRAVQCHPPARPNPSAP